LGRRGLSGLSRIRIEDSLRQGGCPVCSLVSRDVVEFLKSFLYEYVNDPGARRRFRESLGLCPHHAWLLARIVREPDVMDFLGATILYEDVLSTYLESGLEYRVGECMVCRYVLELEESYCRSISAYFREHGVKAYEDSKAVLCSRHFERVYELSGELRGELKRVHAGKLRGILELMRSYIRKTDYASREEASAEEARAWLRAIEALKGREDSYYSSEWVRRRWSR